jgi:hypothetical protein
MKSKTTKTLIACTPRICFTVIFLLSVAVCSAKSPVDFVNPMIGTDQNNLMY